MRKNIIDRLYDRLKKHSPPGVSPGAVLDTLVARGRPPRLKLDWKAMLRQGLSRLKRRMTTWTWTREHRKLGEDFPGRRRVAMKPPKIYALVDVSGSIDYDTLKNFLEETLAIANEFQTPVRVITWDVRVTGEFDLTPGMIKEITVGGGGGTIIDEAIEHLYNQIKDASDVKNTIVIIFTDGYVYFNKHDLAERIASLVDTAMVVYTEVPIPELSKRWKQIEYRIERGSDTKS